MNLFLKKKISVARIGDQVLIEGKNKEWFAEGFYQLKEISELFKDRLGSFTAFGRIMKIENFKGPLFKIPVEVADKFLADGPKVNKKGALAYLLSLPILIYKLRKCTAENDVAWLILPSLAGVVGTFLAPKNTLKVIQMVGEWKAPLKFKYPFLAPLIVPLLNWLTRLAFRRADLAVFVSSYLKEKYGQGLRCEIIVANESRLRPWMIKEIDRSKVHHPVRILYVGRLVPEKGVQFLLESFKIVSEEIDCELWIVGSGPFESTLKSQAEKLGIINKIKWFGWITWGEKLFEIMREADLLVMPSLMDIEGIGMVHFEAMSQSLPVIASRVGGVIEIVKDSISGILVEPGNSYSIAEAIKKIVNDNELRQKLVIEGLKIAKENTLENQTGKVVEKIFYLLENKLKK